MLNYLFYEYIICSLNTCSISKTLTNHWIYLQVAYNSRYITLYDFLLKSIHTLYLPYTIVDFPFSRQKTRKMAKINYVKARTGPVRATRGRKNSSCAVGKLTLQRLLWIWGPSQYANLFQSSTVFTSVANSHLLFYFVYTYSNRICYTISILNIYIPLFILVIPQCFYIIICYVLFIPYLAPPARRALRYGTTSQVFPAFSVSL